MRRSLTYGMLMLFMLFLITANPSDTGESGREFVSWLSQGWDDTREFVSTLVGDSDETIPAIADQQGEGIAQLAVPTLGAAIQNVQPIATPTPLPTPVPESTVGDPPDPQTQSELGTID